MTGVFVLTPSRRETAHHQRCTVCGTVSRTRTYGSAVTFRHKHRKGCPDADFENLR